MAPAGEAYFAPLDRCFNGDHQLWSWATCFNALSHSKPDDENESIKRFLSDPQTLALLLHPIAPFPSPSNQSKSSFETKTSPINVTQKEHAQYDIDEIKGDTLWLSKTVQIDELAALRIVVLEWQTKSAAQLLQSSSLNSVRDPGQTLNLPITGHGSLLAKSQSQGQGAPKLSIEIARKSRLLDLVLQERRYLLKCAEFILSFALHSAAEREVGGAEPVAAGEPQWLADIGFDLLCQWTQESTLSSKTPHQGKSFLVEATTAIQARITKLGEGSGWAVPEAIQTDIEILWGINQAIEMIHMMQIMQDLLQSTTTVTNADTIIPWFRLMSEFAFLEGFQLPYPGLESTYSLPLQSLSALISLTFLNVTSVIDLLNQSATGSLSAPGSADHNPYILSGPATNEINDILLNSVAFAASSPACLAWSVITQTLREIAFASREARELRHSGQAADGYGALESSDTDGSERPVTRSISAIRRRTSTGSDTSQQSTLIEDIHESMNPMGLDEDYISFLANSAVADGKAFDVVTALAAGYCPSYGFEHNGFIGQRMRRCLLDLIRASVHFLEYQPALLSTTIAVVTGQERYWDMADKSSQSSLNGPATLLRQDEALKRKIFLVALTRFPYETLPLLQICRALAFQEHKVDASSGVWSSLEELTVFTCMLPSSYSGYESVREDEETTHIELIEDYTYDLQTGSNGQGSNKTLRGSMMLIDRSSGHTGASFVRIPQGTQGQVLTDSKPLVVAWNHRYSGISYIGKVLQCASHQRLAGDISDSAAFSANIIEAISLITAMLFSAVRSTPDDSDAAVAHDSASSILGQASDGLDRNQDIVSVVFQLFEEELYRQQKPSGSDESLAILVECVCFTHALLQIMPDRVWPFLGRSGLLGMGDGGGRLGAIVSSYEIPTGRYNFLFSCVRLFDALLDDITKHTILRKTPSKAVTRFTTTVQYGTGVSQNTTAQILVKYQRIMLDVFESIGSWLFVNPGDRAEIRFWLCRSFRKLLTNSFETIGDHITSRKLAEPLLPAADIIVDVYLSQGKNDVSITPLLKICSEGLLLSTTSLSTAGDHYTVDQSVASLKLLATLVHLADTLDRNSSYLQQHIFTNAELFARLYAMDETYRLPVIQLFDILVRVASKSSGEQQPPSLLGHLGHDHAASFLNTLSIIDQPSNNDTISITIWRFLGAIVSTRQQWFAQYIFTGETPRTILKSKMKAKDAVAGQSRSILRIALDALSRIGSLSPQKAVSMLEFVALAADYWPGVLSILDSHPHFLLNILNYTTQVDSTSSGQKTLRTSLDFHSAKIASYVFDILTLYTQWAQQEDKSRFAQEILKHIAHLSRLAVIVPSYNASLHSNLRRNFAAKFPACQLQDFERTGLCPATLGDSFFYDVSVATSMLSFDPTWIGRNGQGFIDEVKRVNVNLSLVEAQGALFHSWRSLLVELRATLGKQAPFRKVMAQTVVACLRANADNILPEVFFKRLAGSRLNLAFTLLESLNDDIDRDAGVEAILPVAWDTLRLHNTNLEAALAADDADNHRMLLRILYLSLQVHTKPVTTSKQTSTHSKQQVSSSPYLIDIALEITATIARGFRSLTALLHSSPNLVSPADFSLLTALLRSCLQIPGLTRNADHLMNSFADTATPRCAATLLSWSETLAASSGGDPIYGECALLFLLELSSVAPLAESLAVDGVLSYILSAGLVGLLQSRAFGPFDNPPRMYAIWAKGLLPLMLNLLTTVGPALATEIAAALNIFPHQLARASQALGSTSGRGAIERGHDIITLSMVQELHCLALIVNVLRIYKEAGASAAVVAADVGDVKWDAAAVKEDVDALLQARRGLLGDKIMATNEREARWARMKPVREGVGGSRLEEKVLVELKRVVAVLGAAEG